MATRGARGRATPDALSVMAEVAAPAAGSAMSAVRSSRPTTPRASSQPPVDEATAAVIRAAAVRFNVAEKRADNAEAALAGVKQRAERAEARVAQLEALLTGAGLSVPSAEPEAPAAADSAASGELLKVKLEAVLSGAKATARATIQIG